MTLFLHFVTAPEKRSLRSEFFSLPALAELFGISAIQTIDSRARLAYYPAA